MKEPEARAGEALRALLERIPILQVEVIDAEAVSGDWDPDLIARVLVNDRQHLLVCEYKHNAQPRYARSALLQLRNYVAHQAPEATPVFIAPYISPAVGQLCEENGVGYLDLEGNARNREWARASDSGLVLSEPNALRDAWRDSYTAPPGERLRYYTPLHGSALEHAARSALRVDNGPGRAAFASFSAAQWLSPYARTGAHYFFADKAGLLKLQKELKLAPASKGENVVVTIPKDLGLLSDVVEPAPGAICTSPVQTYLDLSIAGERGAEAANHLRQERLVWPK